MSSDTNGSRPDTTTPPAEVLAGWTSLNLVERQGIRAGARSAVREARDLCAARLQAGELVELDAIVNRALAPLIDVLSATDGDHGLMAAATTAWALLTNMLEMDLDALRALTSHRPSQPAPAPDRN